MLCKLFRRVNRILLLVIVPLLFLFLLSNINTQVFAETAGANTPKLGEGSSAAQWEFDPVTTEVGKNAERSRQLLWWVFSHPAVHTAPVIAILWGFSRNLVYVFVILVIVAFGLSFIVLRKRASAVNIPPIMVKIGAVLLYATFSYIIILVLIQISEVMMRFFIENVGGKDLFNVIFSGAGNADVNYTGFVGYRDVNPVNQEMANTSLFLVKLTSLTYFSMAILLILRTIFLWFLLIVSPFLALLVPFIFIRNTGWIWIGVFFQWLFYGPLMALFLASLTKIWISGIPFPFDFSRVKTPDGQVYRTAINILYGGPAQTLSAGNSANYIDTYAEYVIALVMLWAAIILPWLLLRIFRDYCCEAIAAGNATLTTIFDRIRQFPPPVPPVPGPTSTSGAATELPFRQNIGQKIEQKVHESQKEMISQLREIYNTNTKELARSFDMSVSSLRDVSRLEMNKIESDRVRQNLQKMSQPAAISSQFDRERFTVLKKELQTRAAVGDLTASAILHASGKSKEGMVSQMVEMSARRVPVATPVVQGKYAPTTAGVPVATSVVKGKFAATVARVPVSVAGKTVQTQVSVEDYEEVKKMWLKHYREAPVAVSDTVKTREEWVAQDAKKLTNISNMLASSDPVLKQKGLAEVAEILPFLMLGGFSDIETLTYLKAKLEASKQIQTELEIKEKARQEAVKEVKEEKEEEETVIEVTGKKEEEKKQAEVTKAKEQKIESPIETTDKK